jgi:uncharacterized Fe-S cluster-containing radical SAM superfamily protein
MYQRFLAPHFTPFNPLELARKTEQVITKKGEEGLERKYTAFYSAPVYQGIATGYASGCCLRCFYCWSHWSRDFPEKYGDFYSPERAAQALFKAAERGVDSPGWERFKRTTIEKLRLSGCEPTPGKEHLLVLLDYVLQSKYSLFILETNGILLGSDKDYAQKLAKFREKLYVRVSFKAATPEGFETRTGAEGTYYELPFKGLGYLLDNGIYAKAAAMTDSRVMPKEERDILLEKLDRIDPTADYFHTLEEERIDFYDTTAKRMKAFYDAAFARKLEKDLMITD